MLAIELERDTEKELVRRAKLEGKLPGEFAAELLEHSLRSDEAQPPSENGSSREGFSRDRDGNVTGLDGKSWRELAHEGHRL